MVNVIGPLVALSLMSLWTGALAMLGYIAVASVIVRFEGQIVRVVHRQNLLERRCAVKLLDFLGNIGTVLSVRFSSVSRRLVGERPIEAFEPTRRMIALTEAKLCAIDLLTVALSWLLAAVYVWRVRSDAAPGAPPCWAACSSSTSMPGPSFARTASSSRMFAPMARAPALATSR